jgi:hypothetical protein
MNFNILTWNVRGLNEGKKRLKIRNLLNKWKVDIACFQETKLQLVSNQLVHSLWRCPYKEWCHVASNGASGGILLMWDRRVVTKIDECLGRYVVACSFRNVEDGMIWAFAGVYGPNNINYRRLLWDELAGLMSLWDMPWCIGGDFNATIFHSERSGGAGLRSAALDFADFISDQGLMDLPLAGGVSTWANSRSWSRLDRFLVSPDWEMCFRAWFKRSFFVCAPIILLFF